jgi:ankyrin repeat protein
VILLMAAIDNRIDVLDLLVEEHGVDVDTPICYPHEKKSILSEVSEGGIITAVTWLIQHGADLEAEASVNSYTPLWAACIGYLRVVRILLEAGANPNCVKESSGNSALYMCAQHDKVALGAELLHFGADPNLTHQDIDAGMPGMKMTPVMVALCNGHQEMVAMLMNAGAEIIIDDCVKVFASMQAEGKTLLQPHQRKLTQRQIKQLKALTIGFAVPHLLAAVDNVVGRHYQAAQKAERKRDYRTALRHVAHAESSLTQVLGKPPKPYADSVVSAEWTQLLLDEQRLSTALYGVEHSDGRVSAWERHIFTEGQDNFPPDILFYAWARHGDYVYRHGGHDFTKHEQYPSLDCLWALDLNTKVWAEVKTKGSSPGPRTKHIAVVYQNAMYIMGGQGRAGPADMSLYRLDLVTFQWTHIKPKGSIKPPRRYESSGFVYKNKLYVDGGDNDGDRGRLMVLQF